MMLGRLLADLWKHGIARTVQPELAGRSEHANVIALDEINSLVKGRHGWFLANQYDMYLGRALLAYGEYAELEQQFLQLLARPKGRIVEVGANIGSHTIGLARAVGPDHDVVAIEPQPAIFRVLCANIELNGLSNVRPLQIGCGAVRGSMRVPAIDYRSPADHNSGSVSLEAGGDGIPVEVVPLDEVLNPDVRVQLLKVDVEGMEREVLQGATRLIEKCRPLLYVENDRVEKSQPLIEWIMAADYRIWWHTPPLYNASNFFRQSHNLFPRQVSMNVFCMPKGATLTLTDGMQELTDPAYHPLRS